MTLTATFWIDPDAFQVNGLGSVSNDVSLECDPMIIMRNPNTLPVDATRNALAKSVRVIFHWVSSRFAYEQINIDVDYVFKVLSRSRSYFIGCGQTGMP